MRHPALPPSVLLARLVNALTVVVAVGAAGGMVAAAWHDVSRAWDVWAYHLPFAARLAGVVDARSFVFGVDNASRYAGFPLLAEVAQGIAWRITGRPEASNLVGFAALAGLVVFVRWQLRVPAALAFVAFVAVPLVHIHASSAYVDLPAGCSAAALALLVHRSFVERTPPPLPRLLLAGVLGALAANIKFQAAPIVAVALVALAARSFLASGRARGKRIAVLLAFAPVVFATPLKNVVVHGNPVYPVELVVLGVSLPHVDTSYSAAPPQLEGRARPVRFVHSVAEIGLRPITSGKRWSIDQWTPPRESGYRIGGFFGLYAVTAVLALGLGLVLVRTREARVAAGTVAGVTLVTAFLPQSHELRYYLYWMLVVVALALSVWASRAPTLCRMLVLSAFAVVAVSTGGTYLWPTGITFRELVDKSVDRSVLRDVRDGQRLCVTRDPWTFLYAAEFHPDKPRYVVVEGCESRASD